MFHSRHTLWWFNLEFIWFTTSWVGKEFVMLMSFPTLLASQSIIKSALSGLRIRINKRVLSSSLRIFCWLHDRWDLFNYAVGPQICNNLEFKFIVLLKENCISSLFGNFSYHICCVVYLMFWGVTFFATTCSAIRKLSIVLSVDFMECQKDQQFTQITDWNI